MVRHLNIEARVDRRGGGGVGGSAGEEDGTLLVLVLVLVLSVNHGRAERGKVSTRDGKLGLNGILRRVSGRRHGGEGQRSIILAGRREIRLLLLVHERVILRLR